MAEAPKNWTLGDKTVPNPEWNRPHRIELVTKTLGDNGATEIKVFLGGERFTFTHKSKFVVLDITTRARGKKIAMLRAHIFNSPGTWHRFINSGAQNLKKTMDLPVPEAETEEDIDNGVKDLLAKL